MRISDWSSDVCSSDLIDAKALVEEVYDQFGRIDILVNAAQGFTPLALIEDKTTAMFEYSYRTGLLGSLWTMQAAIPYMQTQADGRIISFCRSEEHKFELQSLMRNSYAVFCLKIKKNDTRTLHN